MADPQNQVSEDEEFEFRARAEQEARSRQQASQSAETSTGAVAPGQEPTTGQKVIGGLQTAYQLGTEYGAPVAEVGGAALGAKKAFEAINAYKSNTAVNQLNGMLDAYTKMTHDIRQYQKMGQPIPQQLADAHARLGQQVELAQSKVPGYNTNVKAPTPTPTAPAAGPVNPATASNVPAADVYGRVEPTMGAQTAEGVAQGARTAAPAAAQGESMLSRFGNLASKYGSAIANNPIINNPVTRFVASKPVQGLLLATHSGDLNAGEGQQIAQMKQWQDNFAKLPVAQQNAYYNLPHDKQIQVNAMIRSGQDPSSILGQTNAITSGYSQQLQHMAR